MGGEWRFERSTLVAADAQDVWCRVVSPEGINDEMRPWMSMSSPRGPREITMLCMRRWVHDRTVERAPGGGTVVTDRVTMAPRPPLAVAGPVIKAGLAGFFRHRHRRLARHFSRTG